LVKDGKAGAEQDVAQLFRTEDMYVRLVSVYRGITKQRVGRQEKKEPAGLEHSVPFAAGLLIKWQVLHNMLSSDRVQ
jgi:hypothetical protein